MNLIVNSRECSPPVEHLWSHEEMERGWQAFEAAHRLWTIEKNYDPRCPDAAKVIDVETITVTE